MKKCSQIVLIICIFLIHQSGYAQNCQAKFECDAGPNLDACSGGQINLSGIIGGDATQAVWKGGKGKFEPSRNSLDAHYFPSDDEQGAVVLTLEAYNSKYPDCKPVSSQVTLSLRKEPHVKVEENIKLTAGNAAQLKATLTGDARQLAWSTSGSGTFSDAHKLDAVYTPSKTDVKNGGCTLTLIASPYPGCPPDNASGIISITGTVKN